MSDVHDDEGVDEDDVHREDDHHEDVDVPNTQFLDDDKLQP